MVDTGPLMFWTAVLSGFAFNAVVWTNYDHRRYTYRRVLVVSTGLCGLGVVVSWVFGATVAILQGGF